MLIRPDDARLTWAGAVSLQRTDEWTVAWRVPFEERGLFHEALLERAVMAAGVRIAFRSDTSLVSGQFVPRNDLTQVDLCCDGKFIGSVGLAGREEFQFDDLPAGEKVIELWLPQFGQFQLRSLALSDGASLTRFEDTRPRWITYGSSISHCRTAESPTQTWPAIVARGRGLNLTCLGFGGQCHLDPMIARLIRDLPADFLSICVGINVQGSASLSPRTFRTGIIGFVKIVREKHPTMPFAVMSPIISPPRETKPNAVGFNLRMMREEVKAAVAALQAHGDRQVHYVDGLEVLGPDLAHLLPDELHPNAEGYKAMGRNFLDKVAATRFF
ncbi:MAG: GDSL family lipase [Planctomycetes bacterium]|nr:GDSL family lipase [Planctomycetota bacterium]